MLNDEHQKAFEMGVKMKQIEFDIIELPLEEMMKSVNHWETITPMLDPTAFTQNSGVMQEFKQKISVLLEAKQKFLKIINEN